MRKCAVISILFFCTSSNLACIGVSINRLLNCLVGFLRLYAWQSTSTIELIVETYFFIAVYSDDFTTKRSVQFIPF